MVDARRASSAGPLVVREDDDRGRRATARWRADCATATYASSTWRSPASPRSCSTHSSSRTSPFASNRFPCPSEPPETFTGRSPSGSSSPVLEQRASSDASPSPSASRCSSSRYAKVSSTSTRSISSCGSRDPGLPVRRSRRPRVTGSASPHVRLSSDGRPEDHPAPSSHTGASVSSRARSLGGEHDHDAPVGAFGDLELPQRPRRPGPSRRRRRRRGRPGTRRAGCRARSSGSWRRPSSSAPRTARYVRGTRSCRARRPRASGIPSGRFSTGSSANASIAPSVRTSETLLCASTATIDATPERISIIPVATPNSPSAGDRLHGPLHRAELVGHVLVEDRRALEEVLRAADERVDLRRAGPRRRRGRRAAPPRTSAPCRRPRR